MDDIWDDQDAFLSEYGFPQVLGSPSCNQGNLEGSVLSQYQMDFVIDIKMR